MAELTPAQRKRLLDGDISRIEKREARLRASFEAQGGLGGETMRAVIAYFTEYRTKPRPHLFLTVIERVRELNLLKLPEHRYGTAGGLAAVFRLHPEHEDEWKAAEGPLLANAELLAPPLSDEVIERPFHVDYLWMNWLVTADQAAWERVYRLAHRTDEVGVHARLVLHAHQTMPEVQAAVEQIRSQTMPGKALQQAMKAGEVPMAQVNALGKHLLTFRGNAHLVVLVGWEPAELATPANDTPHGSRYLVITPDGSRPPGCPDVWEGEPVVVRCATLPEMLQHQALIDASEDP